MNTQSRKQEALSLLALDELTFKQEVRLNQLTAQQAGYQVALMGGDVLVCRPDNPAAYRVVNYVSRVEAVGHCLTLPLTKQRFFSMTRYADGQTSVAIFEPGEPGCLEEQVAYRAGKNLPVDMLFCYWTQED